MRSAVAGGTTVSLLYDPRGLLSEVTVNGTTTKFLYDDADLVVEYNSAGAVLRRYVHGIGMDEPLVWYGGSGTTDRSYFHADELGSIVAISNNSGAGIVSFKYSPDGESANASGSRFGYTGQAWLVQPALYYYKSRMYSPKLGRLLQPDIIGYDGGMNLYAYVGGDPINRVDPHGTDVVVIGTRGSQLPWQWRFPSGGAHDFDMTDIYPMDDWEAALGASLMQGWLDQVVVTASKKRSWLGSGSTSGCPSPASRYG